MADVKEEKNKTFDPFEPFREMRDAYLDAMSKTMVEAVNSEAYAKASGAMLDWSLTASSPFREAMEKSMLQAMQQLSLPSRQEVAALAERFTNLELRVDDLDAKLDRVLSLLAQTRSTPPAEQTESRERPAGDAGIA
jgi:polyhydroxyalkanoate synthesis regulator phasin